MKIEYFLGIGQGKRVSRLLSQQFVNINFHEAPDYLRVRKDAERINVGLDSIRSVNDVKPNYVLIAESQAASAAIAALTDGSVKLPNRLVLIQPLGLNYEALGETPTARRKELLRRSRLFWRHKNQSLLIPGNRIVAAKLLLEVLRRPFVFPSALTFGANQHQSSNLATLADTIPVDVVATTEDSLFPYAELRRLNPNITIHEMPGTHLNRATPNGMHQLQTVLDMLGMDADSSLKR